MHSRGWPITTAGLVLAAVVTASVASLAEDRVSGLITRTYVIVEDTELTGDVTCDVTGAACFSFGAPGVELRLNGYSITGKADPVTGCGGAITAGEFGITTGGRANVSIQGPGLVQRFRSHGVTSPPPRRPVSRASRHPPTACPASSWRTHRSIRSSSTTWRCATARRRRVRRAAAYESSAITAGSG